MKLQLAFDHVHMMLQHPVDVLTKGVPLGAVRSGRWPTARRNHLLKFPNCQVCGEAKLKVEVHHVKPFHLHPELELDPDNLITLCESMHNGVSCHQLFGHLGDFHSVNKDVRQDAKEWAEKITKRP